MKCLKAAAVLAGSLAAAAAAAAAAAPAHAHDPACVPPSSRNDAVHALARQPNDPRPFKHQANALDTENEDSVLSTVKRATTESNSKGGLLGGLSLPK